MLAKKSPLTFLIVMTYAIQSAREPLHVNASSRSHNTPLHTVHPSQTYSHTQLSRFLSQPLTRNHNFLTITHLSPPFPSACLASAFLDLWNNSSAIVHIALET